MKKGFSRGKLKYSVNEKFFDTWTSQMAYILGFTFADGSIYNTTLSWDVQKRDIEILKKIKNACSATYPIILHRHVSCRLRIHNQVLVNSAIEIGLLPKKNIRNALPKIPTEYLRHFIRGYLEGDGWIVLRRNRNELDVGFSSGNREFLELLNLKITNFLNINLGLVRSKIKITPRKVLSTTFQLEYYSSRAFRIAEWLYADLNTEDIYLTRKYRNYLEAKELYNFLKSGTKKVRVVQKRFGGRSIKDILLELSVQKQQNSVEIARVLGVHSSSVYRWLAQTDIKYPVRRVKA